MDAVLEPIESRGLAFCYSDNSQSAVAAGVPCRERAVGLSVAARARYDTLSEVSVRLGVWCVCAVPLGVFLLPVSPNAIVGSTTGANIGSRETTSRSVLDKKRRVGLYYNARRRSLFPVAGFCPGGDWQVGPGNQTSGAVQVAISDWGA